jgi:hypothetical protein
VTPEEQTTASENSVGGFERQRWVGIRPSALRPGWVDFCQSGFGFKTWNSGRWLRERQSAASRLQ